VQIYKKEGGKPIEKIIHSKLQTGVWPMFSLVLEKIHFYLPRIPKLSLVLFQDQNTGDDSEEERNPNFSNISVTLRSSYDGTTSQMQMNQYLQTAESQKA
jgi:hypothetical protein